MTDNPPPVPPFHLWPATTGPDCPACRTGDHAEWLGTSDNNPCEDGPVVHVWRCPACRAEWPIPVRHWPVLEGPDCPVCNSPNTRWQAINPDHPGDTWTCDAGHQFVVDPEGFIDVPGTS